MSSSSSSSTATRTPKRVTFAVTPSPPTSSSSSSCVICGNDEAKYRCPRCHERYCSLSCYKEHSEGRCSQGFYKDQVASYTEVSKPTEEERKNVEMMIYEHNQDDAPDDGGMEEEEVLNLYRLLDVLDDDGVMDDAQKELILAHLNDYLSPDQIDDFRRELKSGHLYKQVLEENAEGDDDGGVVDWSPWWEDKIRSAERSYERSNEGRRRRVPKHRCCHCYGTREEV
ncbi:Zinc finger HIT domain-containing protein 2, variant 2 [Perkinsus olseni]|uniref:Zinc finger HIT domain-containing protein 2, variant 2 n=1 Tax=Perkinsus olseni TaxID=32597 RepID=A0A7J6NJP9_PEROL|nr:Zinc finger HIT domain-containing protein 2, variant 2 [Perkinsus olseni]